MTATVHEWSEVPVDSPIANLDRKRIQGEKVMMAMVTLHPGCEVQMHYHENEQFAYVISGRATFGIGAADSPDSYEVTLTAGQVLHLPSNVPHSVKVQETTQILDVLSPPGPMGVDSQEK